MRRNRSGVRILDSRSGLTGHKLRHLPALPQQLHVHDAEARERGLTPDERLRRHQDRSRPVMDNLHAWLGGTVNRTPDGAELRSGPGDRVSAAALEALDVVPPPSRGTA